MKKTFLSLFTLALGILFLSNTPGSVKPVAFCDALKQVMKEEPKEFVTLRGKLNTNDDGGGKSYQLKFTFDGWPKNEYVIDGDKAVSVDIQSENTTKPKALELFNKTVKQIGECLGIEGSPLKVEGMENLYIFTKDKCDVAVIMAGTSSGNWFVTISVSRES